MEPLTHSYKLSYGTRILEERTESIFLSAEQMKDYVKDFQELMSKYRSLDRFPERRDRDIIKSIQER